MAITMGALKNALLAAGLLGMTSTGCASIFYSMSRDFSAERGVIEPADIPEHSDGLKVITYNLAHCRGPHDFYGDGREYSDLDMNLTIDSPEQVYKCLDDVAEMLIREDADIVLLQEVDKKAVWSYDIDFTPYLAQKTGMDYYAYGSKYNFVWWPYEYQRENGTWIDTVYFDIGNAVISRYPIISADNKPFNEQGFIGWIAGEKRYIDALVDINGRRARFISTHFETGEIESRVMIEEARNAGMPLVFGGTLHILLPAARETCSWCSDEYVQGMQNLIDSSLFNIYMTRVNPLDRQYFTSNTENRYWTADYIIPTNEFAIADYHVIDARLSDHMPVSATLVLEKAE